MQSSRSDQASAAQARAITILVVEDHDATREAVMTLIAGALPGCSLVAAGSAGAAVDACAARPPEVVVMDIALPDMNGIEAARRIKDMHPGTLVVMHSANDHQVYRDEAALAGASAFVRKGRCSARLAAVIAGLFAPGEIGLQA